MVGEGLRRARLQTGQLRQVLRRLRQAEVGRSSNRVSFTSAFVVHSIQFLELELHVSRVRFERSVNLLIERRGLQFGGIVVFTTIDAAFCSPIKVSADALARTYADPVRRAVNSAAHCV